MRAREKRASVITVKVPFYRERATEKWCAQTLFFLSLLSLFSVMQFVFHWHDKNVIHDIASAKAFFASQRERDW